MYRDRIVELQKCIKKRGLQGLIVSDWVDVFYLTGFRGVSTEEREAVLLVMPRVIKLFLPGLYQEEAEMLQTVREGHVRVQPLEAGKGFFGSAVSGFRKGQRLGFQEGDVRVLEYQRMKREMRARLVGVIGIVDEFRIVKDSGEIGIIKEIGGITDRVFEKTVSYLKRVDYTKLTEEELADKMLSWGIFFGAEGWSFEPIVASGSGSSMPHYRTGRRQLKRNAPLLMDFGFSLNGYASDLSRTIFLGTPTKKFRDAYSLVLLAQEECIVHVKPDQMTSRLHEHAATVFQEKNLGQFFIHSLGHGLGLRVHEAPSVGPHSETVLKPGMVITIEPGLYFPGKFGVRIEDDVVVTEDGCEVLTNSGKELICVM